MTIYFWVILIYLLGLVAVAARGSRQVASQEDFSVAGRQLSTFVLFGTMLATWIGTGSIFGNAERAYEVGVAALIIPLGSLAGIALLSRLAARARGLEGITIQDLLERRYNTGARVLGVIALVLAYVTIVSYQYRAAGAVLILVIPDLSFETAVLIVMGFIITYTALAGMLSIAYVGVIQGVTMIVGIVISLPVLFYQSGGLDGMRAALPPAHFDLFGPIGPLEAINLTLPAFLLVLGDANLYQRFFSARSSGIARQAILWTLLGVAFMEFAIILTAYVASPLQPGLEIPGRVIAFAARDQLPVALGCLMLTTIMAIVLSTAGSYLLAPATAVIRDIYQRFLRPKASQWELLLALRIAVVLLGLAAWGLSRLDDQFLGVALYAYTIYGAAITPALVASFFWRRATGAAAVASIVGGTLTTLLWYQYLGEWLTTTMGWAWLTGVDAVVPAIIVSVLLLVVVSLLTPPSPRENVDPFFGDSS